METLVTNFMAGPGAGKSTVSAELFARLKWRGIETELVTEYAKDLVWEKSYHRLDYQFGLFAEQHRRIHRLLGQVQVVVTDSPLLFTLAYAPDATPEFKALVLSEHNRLNNLNIFLRRNKVYVESGRLQRKDRALDLDARIKAMLDSNSIPYRQIEAMQGATASFVEDDILKELKKDKYAVGFQR